ncbi:uncharacterized protein IL334_003514 [Kwoniella shivajii]|uniref:DUF4045 domain-containing protein n=1 Tax=Kwoniella shivajii TaxID=564305 RepID=A0ABZ1CY23_9TREE|nr:hypothetical protein IL334_003514 [Kwoniella shivajii]
MSRPNPTNPNPNPNPTPISSYLPDPNGWIDTAPKSRKSSQHLQQPQQRPLISFNHGIATPQSSTSAYRRPRPNSTLNPTRGAGPSSSTSTSTIRKRLHDVTPTTKNVHVQGQGQGTLKNYFNTPITESKTGSNSSSYKGKGKATNIADRTPLSEKGSPIPQTTSGLIFGKKKSHGISKGSKLKIHRDDFWGSGSEPEVEAEAGELKGDPHEKDEDEIRPVTIPHLKSGEKKIHRSQGGITREKTGISYPQEMDELPPPAQSTRSKIKSPSPLKIIRQTKSPSLPPLTSSLSPEIETEPTEPREPSYSPPNSDRSQERTPSPIKVTHPLSTPYVMPPDPPSSVLRKHLRFCGQAKDQLAAPSPWRKRPPLTPARAPPALHPIPDGTQPNQGVNERQDIGKKRKRESVTKKDEIDLRVLTSVQERRHKTSSPHGKSQEKKLVDLSSSDPPPEGIKLKELVELSSSDPPEITDTPIKPTHFHKDQKRKGLTPVKLNALRNTFSSTNIGKTSPGKSPITPKRKLKKGIPISPLPRTSVIERPRSISPSPIKSALSLNRQQQHTPKKASTQKHYQITPPKSCRPKMSERQETLFILPDPPRQPHFPSEEKSTGVREWKVAEMEPETLLDWGLDSDESEREGDPGVECDKIADQEGEAELQWTKMRSPSSEPPLFSPSGSPIRSPGRRPSLGERWSSKSIEPTILSQNFPQLIPSSPVERGSSSSAPPSSQRDGEGDRDNQARSGNRGHLRTGEKEKGESKWDHLQRGILASTPTSHSPSPSTSSQNANKRKSKSRLTNEKEQSKLASFGFFGDRPKKKLKRDFDKRWDDEEDFDFPEDKHPSSEQDKAQEGISNKGILMSKVPEAPHHPSLRPAGIQELEKRARASGSHSEGKPTSSLTKKRRGTSSSPEIEPPLFERTDSVTLVFSPGADSNDIGQSTTSSSQSDEMKTPGSTRDWFDKLGNRRGSEFGTMD